VRGGNHENNGAVKVAREYREKYGWEMPTLKLARIMYAENKLLFPSLEKARSRLRWIEGKMGERSRRMSTNITLPERSRTPYKLPEAEEFAYEPYIIDAKKVLVMSDVHLPYHDVPAISAAIEFAQNEDIDAILLNGDTLDFYTLSRFIRDPKARSFAHELLIFQQFIEALGQAFPDAKVYIKLGNHDERYQHYLWTKAGELDGVEEFELKNIIKKRAPEAEVIGDKRIIKLGALNVLHGHEFGQSIFSPVNVARGLFLRGKVSAMQGHNHQTSEHTESNMNGEITTTYSVGCLCNLTPGYLPINKWNHGFAIVDINGQDFHVRNYRIHKGQVL
jgi:predicted phosphodiesterase